MHETRIRMMLHVFASHSVSLDSAIPLICPSLHMQIQLMMSILLYIEPVNALTIRRGKSPIDFWFHSTDPSSPVKQAHAVHRAALNRLLGYLSTETMVNQVAKAWMRSLETMFNSGYSHSVQPFHPTAVVLPFRDMASSARVAHSGASAWIVMQSGFASGGIGNAVIVLPNSTDEIPLGNTVIVVKGDTFSVSVKSRFSQRSVVALPIIPGRSEYLFGTVFDLLISLKYYALFVRMHAASFEAGYLSELKAGVYGIFIDGITARSPFFVTFGADILQFLQHNLPLTTSDLTETFIGRLSLLAVYTPRDGFEFIHQFIEEQQNMLDGVYVFGDQDLFSDMFAPGNAGTSPHADESDVKLFEDPFPGHLVASDGLGKLMSNLKCVLARRKDIHSYPFHLLLHRWVFFSHTCPATEITVLSRRVCRIRFSFYVPKSFRLVFAVMPTTIRLKAGHNKSFKNPRFMDPDSVFVTGGNNEMYLRIEGDERITFNNISFFVRSDNEVSTKDFLRDYRSRFLLDAKSPFIHRDTRLDQILLGCYSVKQYGRPELSLVFDPAGILKGKFGYSMHLLCCRYCFLMILNFFYAHHRAEFVRDEALHSLLGSVDVRIKLDRLRRIVARSNGTESDFIRINRKAAHEVRDGQSQRLSQTLISQLTQFYRSPPHFRMPGGKPWRVHLIGEQGCDMGGLAKEIVAEAVADLMCPVCGLVVPIPDARHERDAEQCLMIPMPTPRYRAPLRKYHFAGALIAIAIRSGLPQEFNFAPLVWEYLMTQQITIDSIYSIDSSFHSLMTSLRQAMKSTVNAAATIERFNLRFVVQDLLGRETLLTPRGIEERVTSTHCEQFIALVTEFRINEMKEYLREMYLGLWENIAAKPPRCVDWPTLEYAACGQREISVDMLKGGTTFSDVPVDQQELFWRVVEKLSNDQRSLLLKFVTGRVRLPLPTKRTSLMKVDMTVGDVDKMPTASTCFCQLHLPRYSSFEKARKMIALAIEYTGTFEMV